MTACGRIAAACCWPGRRPRARCARALAGPAGGSRESYALAMHGAPALPPTSPHMPYANPDAPKGGRLVWGLLGTFDSLNPLIVRGLAVQQIRGYVVESLMARGNDEAFTLYGLLAKSVETDDAQKLRHLPSRPRGALLRRQAGHGRRRAVFLGSCCATRAAPIIGSIIPRSQRPRRPTRSRCGSTSAAPMTANCR